jgi:hypothetical protein
VTFPPVVLPGQRLTADRLNAAFLIGRTVFSAYRDSSQAISSSGIGLAADALQWDNVELDILGGWSAGSSSRYTPPLAGWYRLEGGVSFVASTTTDSRGSTWRVNGSVATAGTAEPVASTAIANTTMTAGARDIAVQLNGSSDYIELCPFQDSGGPLNTAGSSRRPFIAVTYTGPS